MIKSDNSSSALNTKTSKAWLWFLASRYILGPSKARKRSASILSFLGIAVGVMAILIVLSVIEGFQSSFIDSILEISSYHIRIETEEAEQLGQGLEVEQGVNLELVEELGKQPYIKSVLPFVELQTIMRAGRKGQQGALVRGIPENSFTLDKGLQTHLTIEEGSFDVSSANNIVVGAELAYFLGLSLGDSLSLVSLSGTALENLEAESTMFTVGGIFRSGYYEYDLSWAFISIDRALELYGQGAPITYGVKLNNHLQDNRAMQSIARILENATIHTGAKYRSESWRNFNRGFFSALKTEKILMFSLLCLIFIVVALNIFQGQRRKVMENYEEIGLLKALGASNIAVRFIFMLNGLAIGISGAIAGLIPGIAIASNIQGFFNLIESIVNAGIKIINIIFMLFGRVNNSNADFTIFSPSIFYVKEIPSHIEVLEVVFICLFAIGSAATAGWLASKKSTQITPAEVLRYE